MAFLKPVLSVACADFVVRIGVKAMVQKVSSLSHPTVADFV